MTINLTVNAERTLGTPSPMLYGHFLEHFHRQIYGGVFDPGHPLADETGHYQGSNVDLVVEIADAREAQRSYEANLKMFDQARQMSSALLDLLRR